MKIQQLWDNIGFPYVDMVLIGIYSGWRPSELAMLKTAGIDFENGTMFGGIKTEAGKNRYVPIHHKILPLIQARTIRVTAHFSPPRTVQHAMI